VSAPHLAQAINDHHTAAARAIAQEKAREELENARERSIEA
jgi:hypothetical protein